MPTGPNSCVRRAGGIKKEVQRLVANLKLATPASDMPECETYPLGTRSMQP